MPIGEVPKIQMPITKLSRSKKTETASVKEPQQYFSRAVSKALETIELLSLKQRPLTLHEIAKAIALSKTSALRLLRTLERAGYLASEGSASYALAPGTQSIASRQLLARLMRIGTPLMRELSNDLHETVSLAALFENRVEVILVVESPEPLRMSNVVGHILPPNASSLGKVICAFQGPLKRDKLLRSYGVYRFTEHSITDRRELDREFQEIQAKGFATDREESVHNGNCFGVPIFDPSGEVVAALSVSVPKVRVRGPEHESDLTEKLKTVASRITAEMRGDLPRSGKK
jgi:IclR family acetate operon transcriptional repressor